MRRGARGYAPSRGHLAELLERLPELSHESMPQVVLEEFEPLLDSSDMTPADWLHTARAIERRYEQFDGFVVLHGTDTMAYTASALSYMLEGLSKPVILTGSQVPLIEPRSDARENLITSLLLSARAELAEVCVYFSGKLMRGNRVTKVSASGFDAFDSPNEPPLAEAGVEVSFRPGALRAPQTGGLRVADLAEANVAAIRLFPGIRAELLDNLLRAPLQGAVLETYGSGNAPSRDPALLERIREATARGVVLVNCTQCLRGHVDMSGYATGAALEGAGVISGEDMTPEAALGKLTWLFGKGLTPAEVAAAMPSDLRGELTSER